MSSRNRISTKGLVAKEVGVEELEWVETVDGGCNVLRITWMIVLNPRCPIDI